MLDLPPIVAPVPWLSSAPEPLDCGEAWADLWLPARPGPHPVVVLWHGEAPDAASDWGLVEEVGRSAPLRSWAALLSSVGVACASVSHHTSAGWSDAETVMADLNSTLDALDAHPAIDTGRVGLFAFSGGVPSAVQAARTRGVRALVTAYGPLDLADPGYREHYPGLSDDLLKIWSPIEGIGADDPLHLHLYPEQDWLPNGVESFEVAAREAGAKFEALRHPTGQHGFDFLDDDDRTREIIASTVAFFVDLLRRRY